MSKNNFQIAFELGAKMDPSMRKTFQSAQKQLGNFGSSMKKIVKTGAKMAAGTVAAGAAVGGAAIGMANKFADTADTIDKTSQKMGLSTDAYQELEYAMGQVGVKQENFEKGLGRLNQRLANTDSNDKYRAAIQKLGVETENASGKTRDADSVFMETVQALHEMDDSTKQAAVAQEIFGTRTSRELMPAIKQGGDAISGLRDEAQEMGKVVGGEGIEAGVLWADTMDKAKNAMGGLFNSIASKALPVMQKWLDKVIDNMPKIRETVSSVMGKVGDYIMTGFEKAQPAIEWLTDTGIPKAKEVLSNVLDTATNFYDFIKNNWSTIKPIVMGLVGALVVFKSAMVAMSIIQSVTGFMKAFRVATAAGRLTMLGLNGAMLANPAFWIVAAFAAVIAIGIAVWKNWDTVKEYLLIAWQAIKSAVATVGTSISNAFTTAYNWVINLFTGIGEWFMAKFLLVKNAAVTVRQKMISAFTVAYNWVINLFASIGSWFLGKFNVVKDAATQVGSWISDKFTAAYDAVTGIFSGIGDWFKGIFDGVSGTIKGSINTIISFANSAIGKLNGISVDIPDWVPPPFGGKSFGLNIPKIPELAEGGITTGSTLAMIGEGSEQEAVLPLSKLEGLLNVEEGETTNNDTSNRPYFHFNPHVEIHGNADRNDVEQAVSDERRKFERWLEEYLHDRDRTDL